MKIKSIAKVNKTAKRYDIEVGKNHNFFANGILVHNSSMTVFKNGKHFGVCSRNYELLLNNQDELPVWRRVIAKWIARKMNLKVTDQSNTHFWKVAAELSLKEKLNSLKRNIAIQGEICGPGINGNMYKFDGYKFFVFSIWDIDEQKYLDWKDALDICQKIDLKCVPLVGTGKIHGDVNKWVNDSEAKSVFKVCNREGIVVRPLHEINDPNIGRLSFKCIAPSFLLGED